MTRNLMRRTLASLIAATLLGLSGAALAEDAYPSKPITLLVPTGPGGSVDRLSRAMAPYLAEELGQPVTVENHPGGATTLAMRMLLDAPPDGYTLITSSPSYVIVQSALGIAPYTVGDFSYINAPWTDFGVLMVPNDRPYQSLDDLVADIRARPGEITTAGLATSDNRVNLALMLNALGIPETDVRFVAYDGGGDLRAAIAGGQVDFAISGAEGSAGIQEYVRPLAVFREQGNEMWDAPPVNQYLSQFDASIPYIVGSIRAFMASDGFREQHPDRWQTLIDAFENVMTNDEAVAQMAAAGIGTEWRGPEATEALVAEASEIMAPMLRAWSETN